MNDLTGKHILVSGASSGIGKAIAIKTSKLGAKLTIVGRNTERLNNTLVSLAGSDHNAQILDITDLPALKYFVDEANNKLGHFSGFVHCAGIEKTIPFRATSPKIIQELFNINVFAGLELARLLSGKKYVNPSGASFVFISSVMGRLGEQGKVAYCATKSALLASVKAMALELSAKKVRCNCVLPGIVETDMVKNLFNSIPVEAKEQIIQNHPLGIGQPEDVAALVCFLLSEEARWITGSEYIIDGGYSAR